MITEDTGRLVVSEGDGITGLIIRNGIARGAVHEICSGERILFKTGNSERCWKTDAFVEDFVYISPKQQSFLRGRV
jgi:hypothetical protein